MLTALVVELNEWIITLNPVPDVAAKARARCRGNGIFVSRFEQLIIVGNVRKSPLNMLVLMSKL